MNWESADFRLIVAKFVLPQFVSQYTSDVDGYCSENLSNADQTTVNAAGEWLLGTHLVPKWQCRGRPEQ